MERQEFDHLVARLEGEVQRSPSGYRLKVAALSMLGYAVVYGSLGLATLLLLGLIVAAIRNPSTFGFVLVKFGIPLGILIALMVRAFWVRFDPPPGNRLSRAESPALFALIDNIRARLKGPPIHAVLIDGQYNAAIAQIPRLGPLGWYRNYLILGLPYLLGQTPMQAAGALAHEYGHLAGAHGKFGSWIYRQNRVWGQLMHALHRERHWAGQWFRKFVDWYYPRFEAYTFVLRRANEYDADRASVDVAGLEPVASGLTLDWLAGRWYRGEFWRTFWSLADARAEPVVLPHEMLKSAFDAAYPEWATQERLDRALSIKTGTDDTHPSLADRLKAIGATPAVPARVGETAGEQFLGSALPGLVAQLDQQWLAESQAAWKERHEYVQRARARLAEFDTHDPDGMSQDELIEYAAYAQEFVSTTRAEALYGRVLRAAPNHVAANYGLGRMLLHRDDERGLAYLDTAMKQDPAYTYAVFGIAYPFLAARGRQQEAERYRQKADERQNLERAASEERGGLAATDPVTRHELPAPVVMHVAEVLRRFSDVKRAWLVRKPGKWRILPEWQVYVLIVKRGRLSLGSGWGLADDIREALEVPGYLFVVPDSDDWAALRKQAEDIAGAMVYAT